MDLRSLPAYRPDAPGARLDDQPWAKSWAAYLKAAFGPDDSARRFIANAWSERVPSQGGLLVPEQLRAQVMAYVTPAVIRPRATVVEMDSLALGLPLLDNPSQANGAQALGGLTFSLTEASAAITPTNPEFGRLRLAAVKIAAYLQGVPNELTTDAAGAMGDLLARVIAMGLSWYEDDLFIANGTGVGQPQSLANASCAFGVDRATASQVGLADVTSMLKALHPAALQAALTPGLTYVRWLLSSSVLAYFLDLYQTVGTAPTSAAVSLSDWFSFGDGHQVGPSMLGIPASVTDHQPALGATGDVILADLSHYVIGDRLEMTVERSSSGPSFAADASDFRIRSRVDGRYWVQSATTTEAGSTVSPVAVLDVHS
jgi:HK97 family phage major capsid protein